MTPWTVAHQAPLSMGFSWQYWSGLPFPSPRDLLDPGVEPGFSCTEGRFFTNWATREAPHYYTILKSEDVLWNVCFSYRHTHTFMTTGVTWLRVLRQMIFFFIFFFISWKLITLQYCSGFCHTLTWISLGYTCIPHPDPPSHIPLHPIPLGLPTSTCLMHPTWAGDLFHPR